MVHIYNGILLSYKKNAFESVLMRQINLQPMVQSEVSQKEKDKYCVLAHVYGIWKDATGEPICRAVVEMQTENRLAETV